MKLFLASEAKHPSTIKKLKEYLGGFSGKSLAYIPTAANGEGWESWKEGDTWKLVNTLPFELSLVQLEEYRSPSVVSQLRDKDVIWFAGGQPGYLMYWIRRTQLDIQIKSVLQKNTLYVGSSAGSMIAGKTLQITEWFPNDSEPGASIFPPLGLVDFDIFPHYEESLYKTVKDKYSGHKIYLLKNGEEIIVEKNSINVIGEERILTCRY